MKQLRLTDRQQNVFRYVRGYIEGNGYPPTFIEIAQRFDFTVNAALYYLRVLERKGYIRRTLNTPRGLRLVESNRWVYRLRASMPSYGFQEGDCVVVCERSDAKPTLGKCVLREGGAVIGVVIGFTRKI